MNCPKCQKKIGKKYYFQQLKKNQVEPDICKACQKHVDIANGTRKERPQKERKIVQNLGILEEAHNVTLNIKTNVTPDEIDTNPVIINIGSSMMELKS